MTDTPAPTRVLVVQTSYLGDLVLATPVFTAIKRRWPDARLAVMTRPECAPVLRAHPDVDEVLADDKRGGVGNLLRLASSVRRQRFDIGLSLHRGARAALLLALAGIPLRVGFRQAELSILYHRRVRRDSARHDVERQLSILDPLDVGYEAAALPRLYVDAEARRAADDLLAAAGVGRQTPFIALAPGSAWESKRWPAVRYAELARALVDRGETVVYLGTGREVPLVDQIGGAAGGASLAGKTDAAELIAALSRATLLVCNDSAPLHLAQALGVPVVAVVGPTTGAQGFMPRSPRATVARDATMSCQPVCNYGGRDCPYGASPCLRNVTADAVLAALEQLRVEPLPEAESPRERAV